MKIKLYETVSGRSPVHEFLNAQSNNIQSEFYDAISWLTLGKMLTMPLSRSLSNIHRGLHELRLKDRSGQFRFFYYVKTGDAIYFVHAMKKKTQKIPKKDRILLLRRL